MSFEQFTQRANFQLDKAEYSQVLHTISSLLQMDSAVITGALDHLAEQVRPMLEDGETFANLEFGLQVFPDELTESCYFSIRCGDHGTFTLKYDPVELYKHPSKKNEGPKVDHNVFAGPLVALDDPEIGSRVVSDTEDAMLMQVESLRNSGGADDTAATYPQLFEVVALPTSRSVREPQSHFRGLVDDDAENVED